MEKWRQGKNICVRAMAETEERRQWRKDGSGESAAREEYQQDSNGGNGGMLAREQWWQRRNVDKGRKLVVEKWRQRRNVRIGNSRSSQSDGALRNILTPIDQKAHEECN